MSQPFFPQNHRAVPSFSGPSEPAFCPETIFYHDALEPMSWLPYDAAITDLEGAILSRKSAGDDLTVTIAPDLPFSARLPSA